MWERDDPTNYIYTSVSIAVLTSLPLDLEGLDSVRLVHSFHRGVSGQVDVALPVLAVFVGSVH